MLRMPERTPLPEHFWDDLREVAVATLTGNLIKRGYRNAFLRGVFPLRAGVRLVGEALTLRMLPAREDLADPAFTSSPEYAHRKAVETIGPRQVLVIDARGDLGSGVLGDILATRMQQRGCAGVVTDGAVRDSPTLAGLEMPVFAAGRHGAPHTASQIATGLGEPAQCAGVLVLPGDVVVGDDDGVVIIPRALAVELAEQSREQERLEAFVVAKIRAGASIVGVYPPSPAVLEEYRTQRTD